MSKDKFLIKIQNITGATTSELVVALIILSGLAAGLMLDGFKPQEQESHNQNSSYFDILDSIATNQQKEYIGIQEVDTIETPKISQESSMPEPPVFEEKKEKQLLGIININTASKLELMKLPGVGEKTALKIINYRKNKKFDNIEEIQNIKGIGPKKFENMKNNLQV